MVSPNVTGALEIQISCDCKIVYKAQEFHAYKPCGNELIMKQLSQLVPEKSVNLSNSEISYVEKHQMESLETNVANLSDFISKDIQKRFAVENLTEAKFEKLFDHVKQIQYKQNNADEFFSKFQNTQSNTNGLKDSDLWVMKLFIGANFCILIGLSVGLAFHCVLLKKQFEFSKYNNGRMNPTYNDKVIFRKGEGLTADDNLSLEHEYGYVN